MKSLSKIINIDKTEKDSPTCPFCNNNINTYLRHCSNPDNYMLWTVSFYCNVCNKDVEIIFCNNSAIEAQISLGDRYAN